MEWGVYVCTHTCMQKLEVNVTFFLKGSLPQLLRQDLSQSLQLADWLVCRSGEPQGSTCLCPAPNPGFAEVHHHIRFSHGC